MSTHIATLGPEGTFAEEATIRFAGKNGIDAQIELCSTVPNAFKLLEEGRAKYAVLPVESTLAGSIITTQDFLNVGRAHICGEVLLPMDFHLASTTELDGIMVVYSHPLAIMQSEEKLRDYGFKLEETNSTAAAAKLAGARMGAGAIVSRRAAKIYGLKILLSDLQGPNPAEMRFIVLGPDHPESTGNDKTSIILDLHSNKSGALVEALSEFSGRNINITRIDSRPAGYNFAAYLYFLDLAGHVTDAPLDEAFKAILAKGHKIKHLGSYPRWS